MPGTNDSSWTLAELRSNSTAVITGRGSLECVGKFQAMKRQAEIDAAKMKDCTDRCCNGDAGWIAAPDDISTRSLCCVMLAVFHYPGGPPHEQQ